MVDAMSEAELQEAGILGVFEGEPVTLTGAECENAAGALSLSMAARPFIGAKGDSGYVVFRYDITGVGFKPVKHEEGQSRRVHFMRFTDGTVVENTAGIEKAIRQSQARVQRMKDAEAGYDSKLVPDEREAE